MRGEVKPCVQWIKDPMFHDVQSMRPGRVTALPVEHEGTKLVYTSDLQAPGIEDYARWIIKGNPDILSLDGPGTCRFGYMGNRINLRRGIDNVCAIPGGGTSSVIMYDHHLLNGWDTNPLPVGVR